MNTKVLVLSQRRVANLVAFCLAYEFEDTLLEVTGGDRIDVTELPAIEFSRRAYKLARRAVGSPGLARRLAPLPSNKVMIEQDYDLLFVAFNHIHEIYALSMLPNWRQRCRKACCFITEAWSDMLPAYLLDQLAEFDHIFVGSKNAIERIAAQTGRPCSYLPLAADVIKFAPVTFDRPRPISVCNIGRRSQITHQALLADSIQKQNFYYYDTIAASGADLKDRTFRVDNPSEHRRMLANILKNSRYYFANRSYVNRPEMTAGREEMSARFYEGAASGTVMIGEAPVGCEFEKQFNWPDAVIHVPFDSPDIVRIIADLDSQPERLDAIRQNGIREAALRHDWLHRIETVFNLLDLSPTDGMQARAIRLNAISAKSAGIATAA